MPEGPQRSRRHPKHALRAKPYPKTPTSRLRLARATQNRVLPATKTILTCEQLTLRIISARIGRSFASVRPKMPLAKYSALAVTLVFIAAVSAATQDQPSPARASKQSNPHSPISNQSPPSTSAATPTGWQSPETPSGSPTTNSKLSSASIHAPTTRRKNRIPRRTLLRPDLRIRLPWFPSVANHDASPRRSRHQQNHRHASRGPADSEGGLTASDDSLWIVSDENGTLLRIDPATNTVRAKIQIPPGSFNPLYREGTVWITGNKTSVLTPVNAKTNEVGPSISVGPNPRFLTSGANSIWTLNQGDGTVTRVDAKTRRVIATIPAGIPGHGGEIAFGANSIWATVIDKPLTQISPRPTR